MVLVVVVKVLVVVAEVMVVDTGGGVAKSKPHPDLDQLPSDPRQKREAVIGVKKEKLIAVARRVAAGSGCL